MQQPFSEYIKIIGKGQKGGRSLTRDEAYHAMKMVLANEVTGDQRVAFLMLLRTREEWGASSPQRKEAISRASWAALVRAAGQGAHTGPQRSFAGIPSVFMRAS